MMYVLSQTIQWIATCFRASGMLAKDAKKVKYLVSLGNLCFAIGGALEHNLPLVTSNVICLVIMGIDIIKSKKEEKNGSKTSRTRN